METFCYITHKQTSIKSNEKVLSAPIKGITFDTFNVVEYSKILPSSEVERMLPLKTARKPVDNNTSTVAIVVWNSQKKFAYHWLPFRVIKVFDNGF